MNNRLLQIPNGENGVPSSADKVAVQYFTKAANPDNYIYQ